MTNALYFWLNCAPKLRSHCVAYRTDAEHKAFVSVRAAAWLDRNGRRHHRPISDLGAL